MEEDLQRDYAAWAVFILPFLVFSGYLSARGELTLEFVGMYWLPAIGLVSIGVLPPPWELLVN
jgi:hypothetical protein